MVGRDHTFVAFATEAPSQLGRGRGFRLQRVLDRVEASLRRRERRRTRGSSHEGAHVLRQREEHFLRIRQRPVQASLRQEGLFCFNGARDIHGTTRSGHRRRAVLHLDALEAEVGLKRIGHRPSILQIKLRSLRLELVVPLREERVRLKVLGAATRRGASTQAIEATRLIEVVRLEPQTSIQLMATRTQRQAARDAVAFNAIFRSAHGDRRTARGGHIGREPGALATVLVAVDSRIQIKIVVHRQDQRQRTEAVLTEARGVEVGIVHRSDGGREGTAGLVSRSELLGQCPVTRDVVPVMTETRDHLERQVLVVLLGAVAARE